MNRVLQSYSVLRLTAAIYIVLGFSVAFAIPELRLTGNVDMDFGTVEYAATATGSIDMGTDGNITYNGMFSGPSIGTSGQFRIRVLGGGNISLGCDTTATLTSGGNSVSMDSIEFVIGSGNRTSFGNGTLCQGIGTPIQPFTLTDEILYMGGSLNISSPVPASGIYSTGNGGGNAISFSVLVL
jgi:hypothetical protein